MEGHNTQIKYIKGDATQPIGQGDKILVHIVNNSATWGKGFVLALSKKWRKPELQFKQLKQYQLGQVQIVRVQNNIEVINMIAQNGIKKFYEKNKRCVDYDALKQCLQKVAQYAKNKSVHMPRIGAGLGGGEWHIIEKIIKQTLCYKGVKTYVYSL